MFGGWRNTLTTLPLHIIGNRLSPPQLLLGIALLIVKIEIWPAHLSVPTCNVLLTPLIYQQYPSLSLTSKLIKKYCQ